MPLLMELSHYLSYLSIVLDLWQSGVSLVPSPVPRLEKLQFSQNNKGETKKGQQSTRIRGPAMLFLSIQLRAEF